MDEQIIVLDKKSPGRNFPDWTIINGIFLVAGGKEVATDKLFELHENLVVESVGGEDIEAVVLSEETVCALEYVADYKNENEYALTSDVYILETADYAADNTGYFVGRYLILAGSFFDAVEVARHILKKFKIGCGIASLRVHPTLRYLIT